MRNKIMSRILCAILILGFGGVFDAAAQTVPSPQEVEKFLETYEPMADSAVQAYNKEDFKEFFKDFSPSRRAKTEKVFKFVWIDGYKQKFGNFISKTMIREESIFTGFAPLLVYKAKFEKNDNVKIKVSLNQENGSYKIFSIRFDAIEQ